MLLRYHVLCCYATTVLCCYEARGTDTVLCCYEAGGTDTAMVLPGELHVRVNLAVPPTPYVLHVCYACATLHATRVLH
eukprot:566893-Rhodomonas_salina.1